MAKKLNEKHKELLRFIMLHDKEMTAKEICKDDRQKQLLFIDLLDAKLILVDINKVTSINSSLRDELYNYLFPPEEEEEEEELENEWFIKRNGYKSKESKERHERYINRIEAFERMKEQEYEREKEEKKKEREQIEYMKKKGWI